MRNIFLPSSHDFHFITVELRSIDSLSKQNLMLDVVHNVMLFTQNIVLPFEKLFKMLVLEECFKRGFMRSYFFPTEKALTFYRFPF